MESLRTFSGIQVELVGAIKDPYELAVASARTCYSGKGIIYPQDVSADEKAVAIRDRIASSTLLAGHITTRQHAHFVFAISGVSRQFIWSFLHSHPFYNSEQVSQRYVKVKAGSFVAPPMSDEALIVFNDTVQTQMQAYERLIELLKPTLATEYFERFKARGKDPEKWSNAINKRAYEVARYVLPVATTAYLYHTVSALTLLRYHKLCNLFETPEEQRIVVGQMVEKVKAIDPLFEKELSDSIPLEETPEYKLFQFFADRPQANRQKFAEEFDAQLEGRTSKLASYNTQSEKIIADAVRIALGTPKSDLSDADAIALVLDPAKNTLLADTLNLSTVDRLGQILHHVHFTFYKKLSHTADSQDQRHRMVMSSRPILHFHYTGKPDYITPFGITQVPEAQALYEQIMEKSWQGTNRLIELGVPEQYAFYLLPNALSVRMVSTGDLQGYAHKWKMRACYNAQEEIFRATIDEIEQVNEVLPSIAQHMKAPCYVRLRAGVKPFCPEGDHFCGLPVWKYQIKDYQRKSL